MSKPQAERSRILPAFGVAAALGGCAVGPNYMAPQTPAPTAPGGAGFASDAPSTAQPPPAEWWRLYNVPALNGLVHDALVHNNNLLQAAANLAQARAALSQARAGRFPSTTLAAGAQHGVSSTTVLLDNFFQGSTSGGSVPSPENYYSYGLDVSYEVDLFGRIRRSIRAAKADVEAQQGAEDFVRVTVAAETTRAYVNACAYAQELAQAQRSLQLANQALDVTLSELKAGSVSDFDVAGQRALVEQTRATVPGFEGQRRTALFELAVLTGRPPEEISKAADACAAPPKLETVLPVGDAQALFRRRPDVRQSERQLAANVERIGVATANLYPTITIGGSAQEYTTRASNLTSPTSLNWLVGPLLSWNFPNTAVAQAQIRQARAAASASLANFQQTVLQALQDTEEALTAYGAELRRNAALKAALQQEQTAYRLAQVRFQNGSASYLDLLTTETALVNAQASLASSDQLLASDQVTVFKALGGGWEQAPGVTPLGVPDAKAAGREITVR
ncbi:MAG: outer rane efflux protein [Phenylobacterium sp.]|nr:outer rane efflux protein [Phenylobacterium sp.]